jgi:uncharacterized protein YjiS (DUF1127 family)
MKMNKTTLPQRAVDGFSRWRVRRATYRALDQLVGRDLKDIGLVRMGKDYIFLNPYHNP